MKWGFSARLAHWHFWHPTVMVMASGAATPARPCRRPTRITTPIPTFGYHEVVGWAKLPNGRKWGGISGCRHGPRRQERLGVRPLRNADDGCVQHPDEDPILKFDQTGKLVQKLRPWAIVYPHGIYHRRARIMFGWSKASAKSGDRQHGARVYAGRQALMASGQIGVAGTGPISSTASPTSRRADGDDLCRPTAMIGYQ